VGSGGGDGIVSYGGSGKAQFNGSGGFGIRAFGGDGYGDVGDGVGGSFMGANGALQDGDGVDAIGGSGVGVLAVGGIGNSSNGSTEGDGIDAYPGDPSDSGSYAGYFVGNVLITGNMSAGSKNFKIDHPQDPENKYLVHASVESSEMMNIYSGNVTTDGEGMATVRLPKWFDALNGDFRYQLTAIGQFAQAIVANEINNNQFSIRTDKPNVKVSWQVTAVRHDAYAKAHPMVVEEAKETKLRGFYIHPELYGAPAEKQIDRARHPQAMKRAKAARAQAAAAKAAMQTEAAAELR
jgi:trimeric autotransporter adhesin